MAISLAFIVLLGLLADSLFRRMRLLGLVGMLLVGILAGPHVLDILSPDMMAVSADFRRIALIVILMGTAIVHTWIEEKEIWFEGSSGNQVPAVILWIWEPAGSAGPGHGPTRYLKCTPFEEPFGRRWEIVYD